MKLRKNPRYLIAIGISAVSLSAFAGSTFAQPGNNIGSPSSPTGPFSASIERRYREIALRGVAAGTAGSRRDERADRAALEQLKDDFKRIQLIRLAMVRDIADGKRFDYRRLS